MKLNKTIFLFTVLFSLVPLTVMAAEIIVTEADSVWSSELTSASSNVTDSTDAPTENLIKWAFVSHADSVLNIGLEENGWEAPSISIYNVAVILAEPSDKSLESSHNKAYFEDIIEQVKDYYCENSFGKWNESTKTCENGIVNFKFDVYNNGGTQYKLLQNQEHYGKDFSLQEITLGLYGNGKEIKLWERK